MSKEVLVALLFGSYLMASFLGLGYFLYSRFMARYFKPGLVILSSISISLGFGAYAFIYFFIYCFINTPNPVLILTLQTLGIVLGYRVFIIIFQWVRQLKLPSQLNRIEKILWAFLSISAGAYFILMIFQMLTPVKLGDAVSGYIETSRWIYHNGLRTYDPHNTRYSTFPVFTEVLYSLSFAFKSEIGAKVMDGLFSLAFLVSIYGFANQFMNRPLAIMSALTFAFLNQYAWLFGSGKIDMVSQFVLFSGLICLFSNNRQTLNIKTLILSAFLIGISIAEKYTNALWLPLLFFYIIYILRFHKFSLMRAITYAMMACTIPVIIILPHFIKDFIWLGNPLAPFNNPLFHSSIQIIPHKNDDSTFISWKEMILFPYSFFIKSGRLPFIILVGMVLYAINLKKKSISTQYSLIIAIGFQLLIWIMVFGNFWYNERFIFALLALLITVALTAFNSYYLKYIWVRVVLLVYFLSMFCYRINEERRFANYIRFISGKESRDKWEAQYSVRAANILKSISDSLDKDHKLMMYSGGVMFNVPYDKLEYLNTELENIQLNKSADFHQYLMDHHFTYLFIFNGAQENNNAIIHLNLTPEKIVFKDNDGIVYRISKG